jgi:hypothetical protein
MTLRVAGRVDKTHTLTLYNVLGEIVLEANLWFFKVKLPMDMPAGIYTAKMVPKEIN